MYDPTDPPAGGIPADPLPDNLPEGDSGEVTDEDVSEPVFDPYGGTGLVDLGGELPPELERGLADANAGRTVTRPLRSDEMEDDDDS
jgi:hypothetical protein